MNVIYFLDPWIKSAEDQKPTVQYHLADMVQTASKKEDVVVTIIGHPELKAFAAQQQIPLNFLSLKITGNESDEEKIQIVRKVVKRIPDLVIAYETDAMWLKECFDTSVVVFETWGALSRPPFPAMTSFDYQGIYASSLIAERKEEILSYSLSDSEKFSLMKIRSESVKALAATDPIYSYAAEVQVRFPKRILLPLQVDNHISFNSCCKWNSHIEMIEEIFQNVDSKLGIIVTQHPDAKQKVLGITDIAYLREKYSNFIYFDETENIPMLSQWWLLYVDAVMTVSSGVAFQAALLGIPVIALGNSHVNSVSSTTLNDTSRYVFAGLPSIADGAIYTIMRDYNVFLDDFRFDSDMLVAMWQQLISKKVSQPSQFQQYDQMFMKYFRSSHLIRTLENKNIKSKNFEFLSKVAEAKAVSFDLFDTLVQRPFFDPHDLFMMIEPIIRARLSISTLAFSRWRRRAEEEARKKRNWKEVTLDQIYNEFSMLTGCSNAQLKIMKEIEIDAEMTVLSQRDPIVRIYKWAQRMNKVVSIITDIYHDKVTIEHLLHATGITGYDYLYVSGELDLRKHDGTLYPLYLSDMKTNHGITLKDDWKNILHAGDNPHADGKMAKEYGIRTHWFPRAAESFRKSLLSKVFAANLAKKWVNDSVVMGLIANRYQDDLQNHHVSSLFAGKLHAFGYMAGGPMLVAFIQYLAEKIRQEKHEKILFIARDGYIMKSIYDEMRKTRAYNDLPPSEYLVLSRRATALATCFSKDDLMELLHLSFDSRRLGDFLENRFGITKDVVPSEILLKHGMSLNEIISNVSDIGRVKNLIDDLSDIILQRAECERDGIYMYMSSKGLSPASNVCMVDIGYSGSIQKNINKIFATKYAGYYILTHEAARKTMEGIIFDGWLASYDEQRSADYHPMNNFIFLFESLLSSEDLSIRSYTVEHGKLIADYTNMANEEVRVHFMHETHAGIMDFTYDFCQQFDHFADVIQVGKLLGSKVMFHLANFPTEDDAKLFLSLNVENQFGGGDAALLLDPDVFINSDGKLAKNAKNHIVNKSQWKQAAQVIVGDKPLDIVTVPYQVAYSMAKHSDIPLVIRKYAKFKRDPYRFFYDSKKPLFRLLRYFYYSRR